MTYRAIATELGCSVQTARRDCQGLGLPQNSDSRRGVAESRRNPNNNEARRIEREEAAFALRLQGHTYAAIGRQMGCSATNVRQWIDSEIERRIGPAVEKLREFEAARLDELTVRAWEVMLNNAGEMRLKAIDRLLQIARRRAALLGLDSPVRVDAVISQMSEQDIALAEMVNEARAANAVIEGELVAEVSDEDSRTD